MILIYFQPFQNQIKVPTKFHNFKPPEMTKKKSAAGGAPRPRPRPPPLTPLWILQRLDLTSQIDRKLKTDPICLIYVFLSQWKCSVMKKQRFIFCFLFFGFLFLFLFLFFLCCLVLIGQNDSFRLTDRSLLKII